MMGRGEERIEEADVAAALRAKAKRMRVQMLLVAAALTAVVALIP